MTKKSNVQRSAFLCKGCLEYEIIEVETSEECDRYNRMIAEMALNRLLKLINKDRLTEENLSIWKKDYKETLNRLDYLFHRISDK